MVDRGILALNKNKELSDLFCKTYNISPVAAILINKETNHIRFYSNKRSAYKIPKNWKRFKRIIFNKPIYPDLFIPTNFMLLMETYWTIFKAVGDSYKQINNESFIANFLYTKIKAAECLRDYGGGQMLDLFIDMLSGLTFITPLEDNYDKCRITEH